MLWYKAWIETRVRFLLSLCAMIAICAYTVWYRNPLGAKLSPATWYNVVLHQAHNELAILWVLAISLLMMGGLLQESAVGAADFTLALPVSRTRLMMARIWMGYAQAMVLVVAPWTAMFLIDFFGGRVHSIGNSLFHAVILAVGGTLFVAWALLVSCLVPGAYTAPVVTLGGIVVGGNLLSDPSFKDWSPYSLLTGQPYLNRDTWTLEGPLPWLRLAITIAIAATVTFAAVKAVERKEF